MTQRPLTSSCPWQLPPSIVTFPQTAVPNETLSFAFQGSIKVTNSGKPSMGPPPHRQPQACSPRQCREAQWCQQLPLRPQKQGSNKIKDIKSSMYGKIREGGGGGSPDQVEGQPVYDEGLEGCSTQSQVELGTLSRSWAPHTVRAQSCCSQRAHLEERS